MDYRSASSGCRFPGQYFLLESGLHYNWHRHYDPTTGRYLQPDPLEFVDGPSLYAYALSAPTQFDDPEGLQRVPRPWGPFSRYNPYDRFHGPVNFSVRSNITNVGSSPPNFATNVCRQQFEVNLQLSGFSQSVTNIGSSYARFERDGSRWQIYQSSGNEVTARFFPATGLPGFKIRLPR